MGKKSHECRTGERRHFLRTGSEYLQAGAVGNPAKATVTWRGFGDAIFPRLAFSRSVSIDAD
jgi:hypothetical protein